MYKVTEPITALAEQCFVTKANLPAQKSCT